MQESVPVQGSFDGVPFSARPERFAGGEWWRVYVDSNPRVLLRYREYATQVAEVLAADEAQFRRASRIGLESAAGKGAAAANTAEADTQTAPSPEERRSWRR